LLILTAVLARARFTRAGGGNCPLGAAVGVVPGNGFAHRRGVRLTGSLIKVGAVLRRQAACNLATGPCTGQGTGNRQCSLAATATELATEETTGHTAENGA